MGAPIINADEFAAFVLVLTRISMIIALAPILGSPALFTEVKVALAFLLTFVLAPTVHLTAGMMPMTWMGFVALMAGELIFGAALAFMVRLVVEAANLAGEYIGFQMGLSIANVMNLQTGGQVSVIGQVIYLMTSLIFLYANGHMLIIKALAQSFEVAPPGALNMWEPQLFTEIIKALVRMYVLAIKIAAPVVAVLFCIKAAFGIVAKAVPQMNVLFVGMPVYILVGLAIMLLSMPWWTPIMGRALVETEAALDRALLLF